MSYRLPGQPPPDDPVCNRCGESHKRGEHSRKDCNAWLIASRLQELSATIRDASLKFAGSTIANTIAEVFGPAAKRIATSKNTKGKGRR